MGSGKIFRKGFEEKTKKIKNNKIKEV